MATEPTNPIVHVAENDGNLPNTGQPNKQVPSAGLLDLGYDKSQSVFSEHLNYILDNIAEWQKYFKESIDELTTQAEQRKLPVGSIFSITGDSTNPATLFGYGVWEATGQGRSLIGAGEGTDSNAEAVNFIDGDTLGEYNHTVTTAELPPHTHDFSGTTDSDSHTHDISAGATDTGLGRVANSGDAEEEIIPTASYMHEHDYSGTTTSVGSGDAMNNIHPVQVVYFWKRTA